MNPPHEPPEGTGGPAARGASSSSRERDFDAEWVRRIWDTGPRRTKPGPRPSLSLAMIVEAGMALADEHGIEGLSLVRVAQKLGVTTNALYRHIGSRDELDILVQDHVLGPPEDAVMATAAPDREWETSVIRWASALRSRYLEHPWLAELTVNVPVSPNALAWLEALLAALEGSGLDRPTTLRAAALLDGYVKTRSLTPAELTRRVRSISDPEAFRRAIGPLLVERGLERVATVVQEGHYRPAGPPQHAADDDFDFGLRCIIGGLRAARSDTSEP